METDVRKILQSLAGTAANAAEEARNAAQSAKKAVAGKYDEVRLNMELSRLHTQQERLFADIGRTLFLVQCGNLNADEAAPEGDTDTADTNDTDEAAAVKTPQQTIDSLLVDSAQLQHEIDTIREKLAAAKNEHTCPACSHACGETDVFCSVCGAKL